MNLKFELKRDVQVECYRILGTVSRAQKRDELHAILQLIQEQDKIVDKEDVHRELLNAVPLVVSERMLFICEKHKLLEKNQNQYYLTKSGAEALDKKRIFVPEYDSWTVWATQDELLPNVLMVELAKKNSKKNGTSLPPWFNDLKEQEALIHTEGKECRIDNFDKKGESIKTAVSLKIIWTLDSSGKFTVSLNGNISGKSVNMFLDPPNISFSDLWHSLLEQNRLLSDWNDSEYHLKVSFDDLDDSAKSEMVQRLKLDKCNLIGLGGFNSTSVERVPVYPRTTVDASKWAQWKLQTSIDTYMTKNEYEIKRQNAIAPFSQFNPTLPPQNKLAESIRNHYIKQDKPPIPRYWHLQAPIDWNL